jgi:tetratricopeptide (TPR) repeat protein
VWLLVGGLIGFTVGYFAGGGGGSAPSAASPAAPGDAGGGTFAALQEQLARDPRNPKLLAAVGNWHYDRGEWDDAIAFYEKSLRREKAAAVLSDLGAAHRNRGEFARAIALFQQAREADPEHWQALLNLVLVQAFDQRDGAAAAASFRELKAKYPEIPNLDALERQIAALGPRA